MSPNVELLIFFAALGVIAFLTMRLFRNRRVLQADQSHLGRLLGRLDVEVQEPAVEPPPGPMARRFRAAGFDRPAAFLLTIIAILAFVVMVTVSGLSRRLRWAGPIAAVVTVWTILSLTSEAARQRAWRFERRLVDAIDLMVGALSAGQTPVEAIASGAEGALEPVKSELNELASQLRASVPIERAVKRIVERYDSEGVRIFTQLLIAKWEVGGPLAPALQAVTRTMRHGLRLRGQLHTHVSGAQTAAMVVALVPYLLIAFFLWKRPDSLALVWRLPWGPQLFAGAVVLQLVGFIWLRRILRIEL
ncbi:MAG: type II secretion system F family protein [Acidobacteriota bacterium]